jgi:hypothetical protein
VLANRKTCGCTELWRFRGGFTRWAFAVSENGSPGFNAGPNANGSRASKASLRKNA